MFFSSQKFRVRAGQSTTWHYWPNNARGPRLLSGNVTRFRKTPAANLANVLLSRSRSRLLSLIYTPCAAAVAGRTPLLVRAYTGQIIMPRLCKVLQFIHFCVSMLFEDRRGEKREQLFNGLPWLGIMDYRIFLIERSWNVTSFWRFQCACKYYVNAKLSYNCSIMKSANARPLVRRGESFLLSGI